MTHARHRKMLDVILGESREHQRLFEQAAAGMEDLLGGAPAACRVRAACCRESVDGAKCGYRGHSCELVDG